MQSDEGVGVGGYRGNYSGWGKAEGVVGKDLGVEHAGHETEGASEG